MFTWVAPVQRDTPNSHGFEMGNGDSEGLFYGRVGIGMVLSVVSQ